MAYSPINIFNKQILSVNARVDIVEQTANLHPDNTEESGSLKDLEESSWYNLANINTFTVTPETEDDEIEYFDANTLTRVKDPQTKITRYGIEMGVVNYPVLFDAIAAGIPNPTSAAAQEMLSAGSAVGAPIFASNDPDVPVGMRIRFYNAKKGLLKTQYFYAKIKATGETEYNGKTIQPTINAEVQQSVHNLQFNEVALTGQTETT